MCKSSSFCNIENFLWKTSFYVRLLHQPQFYSFILRLSMDFLPGVRCQWSIYWLRPLTTRVCGSWMLTVPSRLVLSWRNSGMHSVFSFESKTKQVKRLSSILIVPTLHCGEQLDLVALISTLCSDWSSDVWLFSVKHHYLTLCTNLQ